MCYLKKSLETMMIQKLTSMWYIVTDRCTSLYSCCFIEQYTVVHTVCVIIDFYTLGYMSLQSILIVMLLLIWMILLLMIWNCQDQSCSCKWWTSLASSECFSRGMVVNVLVVIWLFILLLCFINLMYFSLQISGLKIVATNQFVILVYAFCNLYSAHWKMLSHILDKCTFWQTSFMFYLLVGQHLLTQAVKSNNSHQFAKFIKHFAVAHPKNSLSLTEM